MHPAVSTRVDRKRTTAILVAAAIIVVLAALLTARIPRRASASDCGNGTEATVDGMKLAVRAQQCRILRGASETHVAVELTAPPSQRPEREAVALALVIDRSHSMEGQPLRDAKAAALRALDALSPHDAFSVVAYNSRAEELVPLGAATEAHKARARAAIERLTAPPGGTNISDGLDLGARTLAAPCQGDCPRDRIARVLLISDGDPNDGIYDREGLVAFAAGIAESGVSITTVGVGLEFDERIMSEMAVAGRGNYHFVEEFADLATMFDQELGSLHETVAVDTRLELVPAAGVEIVEAYGYRVERRDGATTVAIADLRAGESRKVVLRLRVVAGQAGPLDLVATRLLWRPVGAHQQRAIDGRIAVTVTDDVTAVQRSTVAAAERQVQEAQMANAIDQATEAYERGDRRRAGEILEGRARQAAEAAAAIGDAELQRRLDDARQKASSNFAAPPRGSAGSRATKQNRNLSYDLAR